MPVRAPLRRFVIAGLLVAGLGQPGAARQATAPPPAAPPGQAPEGPKVDPAIIAFAAARSDAERAALLAATPALTTQPLRQALADYAGELMRRRDYIASERAYLSMKWLGETMGDSSPVVAAILGLGTVQGSIGNLTEAVALTHQARDLALEKNNPSDMQAVANNLSILHRRLGDLDAAMAATETALSLAQQLKKPDTIARVYNNLGLVVQAQGNARLALDYYKRSLDLKEDDGGRGTQEMANTFNNIGGVYSEQGDYEQALTHYRKALALLEKIKYGPAAATSLSNIGQTLAAMGQPAQAREALQRALVMTEQNGDAGSRATVIYNLGTIVRDEGKLDEAEALQRQALAIRERSRDRLALTESLSELASLLEARGRADEAHTLAARAIDLSASAGLLGSLVRAQVTQARILTSLNQVDAATAMYADAIRTVEELRDRTGGEQARQVFLSVRLAPYLGLAAMHAQAGRAAEALLVVEQARARTLLDILAEGRQPRRSMTADEQREERRLTNAVTQSALQLTAAQQGTDRARIAAREKALRDARLAREAFVAALYEARPDLQMARGDAPVLTRQQLARLITPGTAALEVVIDAERVWQYLVTAGPDGPVVSVRQLDITATDLVAQAGRFSTQVASRDLGFAPAARRLYDLLIGGVESSLSGVTQLIVVPDAVLWRLPFQALQSPRGTFLIEERSLSYAPSLSAVAALRERKARRASGDPYLLALGDPTLPSSSAVSRLPEAAREVRELGRLYGAGRSTVLVDAGATERALRSSAMRASVLHIATHGVMDDENPMYSHLTLASPVQADSGADGRLEAWELLDMQLTADLAVLSACETANGRVGGGEGVIGLSWALFAAGASTAVVSQWEVDSASTTALMIGFHEQLLARRATPLTPAEALRASATALMKDPRYRHPFYWAGFIVIGS